MDLADIGQTSNGWLEGELLSLQLSTVLLVVGVEEESLRMGREERGKRLCFQEKSQSIKVRKEGLVRTSTVMFGKCRGTDRKD